MKWRGLFRRRRYRWEAVIIGNSSGNESPMPIIQFETEEEASEWVRRMHAKATNDLTRWEYRPIQGAS